MRVALETRNPGRSFRLCRGPELPRLYASSDSHGALEMCGLPVDTAIRGTTEVAFAACLTRRAFSDNQNIDENTMPFKADVYRNQTDMLRWLQSLGHTVEYGTGTQTRAESFRARSCELKKRFELEPKPGKNMTTYKCKFCGGWHLATARAALTKGEQ